MVGGWAVVFVKEEGFEVWVLGFIEFLVGMVILGGEVVGRSFRMARFY